MIRISAGRSRKDVGRRLEWRLPMLKRRRALAIGCVVVALSEQSWDVRDVKRESVVRVSSRR